MNIIEDLYKSTFIVFLMSMLATAIGNVIDGIIIGNLLGSNSMAAFGFTNPYQKFTAIFPNILALGMQILCSQNLGKGKLDEANGVFSIALNTALSLAVFFIAMAFIFPAYIANILGAEESLGIIHTEAINYLQAYSLGLPAVAAVALLSPIMQLDGDRKRAVTAVTILSASNVIGDLICVKYFGGTMWGIGIATTVSYCLAAGFLILHFFKPTANFKFTPAFMQFSKLKEMLFIGSPSALGRGASMLQAGFLNYIALSFGGGAGVAAVAIFNNIFSMIESVPKALSSAIQIISAILIGEEDKKSILRLVKVAVKYSTIISLIIAGILILSAPLIADIYTADNEEEVFELVTESISWIAYTLVFMTFTEMLQYFYQAQGRFKLVNIMAFANNVIFVVPFVLLLTPKIEMTGIWAGFFLSKFAVLLVIILGVLYYYKKITLHLEDMLLLPKDFDSPNNPQMNMTVNFKDDDLSISEVVEVFLEKNNISRKKTMYAAICVEEIVKNIFEYGFNDGKQHSIDIRVLIKGEEVTLRIRDDCRPFNPKKWNEIYNPEDVTAHIGIRLVEKMAKSIQYVNVMNLNYLTIKI